MMISPTSERLESLIREYERERNFHVSAQIRLPHQEFHFRPGESLDSASLTKLYIFDCFVEEMAGRDISLSQVITIPKEKIVGGSGLIKYAHSDVSLDVESLLLLMLSYSDNTAANILLDIIGIEAVQAYIGRYRLSETRVVKKMMITSENGTLGNNKTSVSDVCSTYFKIAGEHGNSHHSHDFSSFSFLEKAYSGPHGCQRFAGCDIDEKLLSVIHVKNPEGLPYYLENSRSPRDGQRLGKFMNPQKLIYNKPATGQHVFHDSLLFRCDGGFGVAAVMIVCPEAEFHRPDHASYIEATHLMNKIGACIHTLIS
jgi:hypothetical protein